MKMFIQLVALGVFASGLGGCKSGRQAATCHYSYSAQAQQTTYRTWLGYLRTGDWRKRRQVQDATDEYEIEASRILSAFSTYCLPTGDGFARMATLELLRNPRLTVILLKPILYEHSDVLVTSDDIEDSPGFRMKMKHDYISLCRRIAMGERDGFAYKTLKEIRNSTAPELSEYARIAVEIVDGENWKVISATYKTTGTWKELMWLSQNYLRVGMPEKDVYDAFGPGAINGQGILQYRGKRSGLNDCLLHITFSDATVTGWVVEGIDGGQAVEGHL